jgi:glycogen phosphorylase
VQVRYGSVNHKGELVNYEYTNLNLISSESNLYYYEGTYICPDTGNQGFTVRVLPTHPLLVNSAELYLCSWGK